MILYNYQKKREKKKMKKLILKIATVLYVISLIISPWLFSLYNNILVAEYGWKVINLFTFILVLTAIYSCFTLLGLEEVNEYDND